jgi:hypothetical protein
LNLKRERARTRMKRILPEVIQAQTPVVEAIIRKSALISKKLRMCIKKFIVPEVVGGKRLSDAVKSALGQSRIVKNQIGTDQIVDALPASLNLEHLPAGTVVNPGFGHYHHQDFIPMECQLGLQGLRLQDMT